MCENRNRNTRWQCQLEGEHEWHSAFENLRTIQWNDAAGFIPKEISVNFIIPEPFRAVKGK